MFSCVCFIDDHHCVYTANDVYVCESSSSVYCCYLCAASRYICLSGRLGPRVCQDAPSFGNSLSRCSIFRQVTLLSSVCVCVRIKCVCVWAFGSSCMSGCSILWQQPVKMFHLLSGDPFVLCVCMCLYVCVCLGVWVLVYVRMLHPLATACQDVPSFVR